MAEVFEPLPPHSHNLWAQAIPSVYLISISLLTTAVVFANSWAYLVNPFAAGNDLIRIVQLILFWIGWLSISFGPAVIAMASRFQKVPTNSVLWIGIGWPAIILLIQFSLFVRYGQWFLGYLQQNQWLLVSDVMAPAALILLYLKFVKTSSK